LLSVIFFVPLVFEVRELDHKRPPVFFLDSSLGSALGPSRILRRCGSSNPLHRKIGPPPCFSSPLRFSCLGRRRRLASTLILLGRFLLKGPGLAGRRPERPSRYGVSSCRRFLADTLHFFRSSRPNESLRLQDLLAGSSSGHRSFPPPPLFLPKSSLFPQCR